MFVHDCAVCIALGSTEVGNTPVDLYYCRQGHEKHPALASLIARYGSEGQEYIASHPPEAFAKGYVAKPWEALIVARARAAGVYLDPSPGR